MYQTRSGTGSNSSKPDLVVHAVTREPVSFPVIRENSAASAFKRRSRQEYPTEVTDYTTQILIRRRIHNRENVGAIQGTRSSDQGSFRLAQSRFREISSPYSDRFGGPR